MFYRTSISTLLIFAFLALFPLNASPAAENALRVYAWPGYFPPWLTDAFHEETGIRVTQTVITDNSPLVEAAREADVITPSAEMVQLLISNGLLTQLDKSRLPGLRGMDPWFAEMGYDQGFSYSVPLFWGALYMGVNEQRLPPGFAERIRGFKDLSLPELRGRILLPDDYRSLMSVSLLALGYTVNDFTPQFLDEASRTAEELVEAACRLDTATRPGRLAAPEVAVCVAWGNAELGHMIRDDGWRFFLAHEGSPVWIDAMAIPEGAVNVEGAYKFIDFVLRQEVLSRLANESGYAIASDEALKLLPEERRNNTVVFPPSLLRPLLEPELMLPAELNDVYYERWRKMRAKHFAPAGEKMRDQGKLTCE